MIWYYLLFVGGGLTIGSIITDLPHWCKNVFLPAFIGGLIASLIPWEWFAFMLQLVGYSMGWFVLSLIAYGFLYSVFHKR